MTLFLDHGRTGLALDQLRCSGASIARILHPPGQRIEAHVHDWPGLVLYRLGGCLDTSEAGDVALSSPCVLFQPGGAAHANDIGTLGFETLTMTFDPAWLPEAVRRMLPRQPRVWSGARASSASSSLPTAWACGDHAIIRAATWRFLLQMLSSGPAPRRPGWANELDEALAEGLPLAAIARRLQRHPAWLAQAYRRWRGEGVSETVRRRRVERAVLRLRFSDATLREIAAEADFCDQSHMNRAFRAVLGRTPLDVRREAALLAPLLSAEQR